MVAVSKAVFGSYEVSLEKEGHKCIGLLHVKMSSYLLEIEAQGRVAVSDIAGVLPAGGGSAGN